jgi:hypothetical protein
MNHQIMEKSERGRERERKKKTKKKEEDTEEEETERVQGCPLVTLPGCQQQSTHKGRALMA